MSVNSPEMEIYVETLDEGVPNHGRLESFRFVGTNMRVRQIRNEYGMDWGRLASIHNRITRKETGYTPGSRAKTYTETIKILTRFFPRPSLFNCAKTLLKIKGLVLPTERARFTAFLALIHIQRALRKQVLSDDELEYVSDLLGYGDQPITRVDLYRARRKLLKHLPGVLHDWKQTRARTHSQALHHAVKEYAEQEHIYDHLAHDVARKLQQHLVRVTQNFLKTSEGKHFKSYRTWAQAIVIETIKQIPHLDYGDLIQDASLKIKVSGTARWRLRNAMSQVTPIQTVMN